MKHTNITVLGAGAWGTTLAVLLSKKGFKINVWEISKERCALINRNQCVHFQGVKSFCLKLNKNIKVFCDLNKAVTNLTDIIIFAVPSQFVESTANMVSRLGLNYSDCVFVSVVKGITENLQTMTTLIKDRIPSAANLCALSGPNFAIEIAHELPAATVIASSNIKINTRIQHIFMTDKFRVYTSEDIAGVQLGGALKNVIAVACGISDGMKLGDNTKATLITRGIREIIKVGQVLGGKAETFIGLSGIGDLMLTCFSNLSRNRALGEKIGAGLTPDRAKQKILSTTEGYRATKFAFLIGNKFNLDLPIINETYSVVYKKKAPAKALSVLMTRTPKPEN